MSCNPSPAAFRFVPDEIPVCSGLPLWPPAEIKNPAFRFVPDEIPVCFRFVPVRPFRSVPVSIPERNGKTGIRSSAGWKALRIPVCRKPETGNHRHTKRAGGT